MPPVRGTLRSGIAAGRLEADLYGARFVLAAAMKIGDLVTWNGRAYLFRGLEPMSVPNRRAELEDLESGERRCVLLEEVLDHPAQEVLNRDT